MAKSPSITIREVDKSTYAVTTSSTVLAIVGYGTKGPIGKAQKVTSRNEFINKFGPLPEDSPFGHLAAYRAFNQTNQVIYYRVAEQEGDNAATAAERAITNSHGALAGYQTFSKSTPVAFGSYTTNEVYDFALTVDGNTSAKRKVFIPSPSTGDWTLSDIATNINNEITSDTKGFQEFSTTDDPSISSTHSDYRFKASFVGSPVASGEDFSIILNPGDSLTDIASAVSTNLAAGTKGYQRWDIGDVLPTDSAITGGLSGVTEYSFDVSVNGAVAQTVTITTDNSYTYQNLLDDINSAMDGIDAYAYLDDETSTTYLRVQSSATTGPTSTIVLTDVDLFSSITDAAGTPEAAVDGVDSTLTDYSVEVNNDTGRIRVISETTGDTSTVSITEPTVGQSLITLLNGVFEANDGENALGASCAVNDEGKVKITSDSTGSGSAVLIETSTTGSSQNEDLVTLLGTDTAVSGEDAVFESDTDNILFTAKEKGSATNNISIKKSSRTSPIDDSTIHTVEVYYNDEIVETFDDVSLDNTEKTFFQTVMNKDPQNGGSEWVEVETEANDGNTTIEFSDGTYLLGKSMDNTEEEYEDGDDLGQYDYRVGTNGIPESGGATLFVNALANSKDLGNTEVFDYHILTTPDNGSQATQNAAIQLAQFRKDFIYVADPPYGLEYDEVADWHNGKGSFGRDAAINTSYAATYWPWLKTYDGTLGEYIWCPPSIFIGEKYIQVDNRFAPWYAPAGDNRGRLVASDIETSPSKPQRDLLYGDLNAVNPIVEFTAKGIEIYGQKTLYRANSAINRVHVRRTLIYMKKLIKSAMEGMIFEPHTPDSWNRATNLINSILEPIRQDGGLEDYRVQIDGNTNDEDAISQSVMKGVLTVVPSGVIESVDLSLKFLNPGAEIEEV